MSQAITMSQHESKHLPGVVVLRVKGSIDSDTAPRFEKQLDELLQAKQYRLLVDLKDVDYISSAGIGVFVGMLQAFRDHRGGDLKAMRASKKIMKIFASIGMDDMIDFYPEEADLKKWSSGEKVEEPLDHFEISAPEGDIYSGEAFSLRIKAKDASGGTVTDYRNTLKLSVPDGLVIPGEVSGFDRGQWEGEVAVTASGTVTLKLSDGHTEGTFDLDIKEREGKAEFPLTVQCSTCDASITVTEPDVYRCEECDETFYVDAWGHTFTLKAGSTAKRRKSRYKGVEMKINTDVNYMSVIRTVISGLCRQEGMEEVTANAVVLAIEEIVLNIIEHGNDFDPWQIMRLKVEFQKKQIKIQIRDYGDPFDVTKQKNMSIKSSVVKGSRRGVGGFLVNQLMDQVRYVSQKNYNELTLVKKYGAADEDED